MCLNGTLNDVDKFFSEQSTTDPPPASQEKLSGKGVSEDPSTSTCEPMPEYLPSDKVEGLSEAVDQLNIDGPLNKEERDGTIEDDGWTVVGKSKQR